jgi:hypothetical protein
LFTLAACSALLFAGPIDADERPNVVYIISDDQAFGD